MKSLIKLLFAAGLSLISPAVKAEEKWTPKPYVETGIYSDYVFPNGAMVRGIVRQDLAALQLPKGFDVSVWDNYSFADNEVNEIDLGINYTTQLTDSITANAGAGYWNYPTKAFGDDDIVGNLGFTYSKDSFKAKITETHLFRIDDTKSGDSICLKLIQGLPSLNWGKTKIDTALTVSTANNFHYYGASGLAHVTAGATIGLSRGKWSLNAQINYQKGLQDEVITTPWGGASLGYQF